MRKYLPLFGVYFVFAIFIFSAVITAKLTSWGVSPDVIRPLMAFLTITILTWSGKNMYDKIMNTSQLAEVGTDVKEIKEDNKLLHISVSMISEKVDRVATEVDSINEYRDEKKRRYREFEQDWMGMRENIRQLNNNDVYSFARLMKEAIRSTTMDFHSSGAVKKLTANEAIELLKEKYTANKEEVVRNIQFFMPDAYLDYFFKRLAVSEKQMWKEVCDTFENRVNRKDEGIQLVSRNFLRATLNTLVVSWADWVSDCNDEKLLERHLASEYYKYYLSTTVPCKS
jgi:hypothetical protein